MLPMIRRCLRDYLPGKGWLYFWGLVFLALNVLCMTLVPASIRDAVDILNASDGGLDDDAVSALRVLAMTIIGFGVGLAVFRVLSRVVLFLPGRRIEAEVRRDVFRSLMRLSPSQLSRFALGDLISRGTQDVSTTRVTISMGILHAAGSLMLLVLCLVQMIKINVLLTIVGLIVAPLVTPLVKRWSRQMMHQSRVARDSLGTLSESIRETFRAHTLMMIYPVSDRILARYEDANDAYRDENEKLIRIRVPLWNVMASFVSLNLFLLVLAGGYLIVSGRSDLTIGQLVELSILLGLIQEPLRSAGMIISLYQRGEVSLERLYELMDAAAEQDSEQEQRAITDWEALSAAYDGSAPLIHLQDVRFSYPDSGGGEPFTLEIPDLSIESGQRIGIFGPVGSGKTTLLKVLTGNQPVSDGECLFQGVPYGQMDETLLLSRFALAPQENRHFARTIQANIDLVQDHPASVSVGDESLRRVPFQTAYDVSALEPDVDAFPDGLDELLGENGINLSGGQSQRLSILRALLKPHQVLVLDDVVSAVDHDTEERILTQLYQCLSDQTLLFVSHRISALKPCDEIWILDEGRVVARGTHDDLLERHEGYRHVYEHQVLEQQVGDLS